MNRNGAIFIAAPREISQARFKQIIKHYLPKAPIILGISKEPYVVGFEGRPQFTMLKRSDIESIVQKVNTASPKHSIDIFEYSQSELASLVSENNFSRVLLVNGSWKFTFQNHPAYTVLKEREIPFKYISPFASEDEAMEYDVSHQPIVRLPEEGAELSEQEMMAVAMEAAKQSYDYSFQTGVALGRHEDGSYTFLLEAFNKVVPYQTYALHHGNAREKHVSAVHDTAHYDTIHAEMLLLTKALRTGVSLHGTTLFLNLLPCPSCARTLCETDIDEIVYINDHSGEYAVKLLEACGKTVRKVPYNEKERYN